MRLSLAFAFVLAAAPAFAGTATETVRKFYEPVGAVTDPELRHLFVDPALTKLEQNDKVADTGMLGCIDFALAIDAQDLDEAHVAKTLQLIEEEWKGKTTVTARLHLFPDSPEREIVWSMEKVGHEWKVADIGQAMGAWVLSDFECE